MAFDKNNIRELNFKAPGPHFLLPELFTIFSNWNSFEHPPLFTGLLLATRTAAQAHS